MKTVGDVLQLLNSGKEVQFNVQFVEGETFKAWQKKLEKAPHLKQTLVGKTDVEIFDALQLPDFAKAIHEQKKIEGWLYPDTYNYTPNSTDLDL